MVDKSPLNFQYIGLLAIALPRARFIYCRRDAIANCWAIHRIPFDEKQTYAHSLTALGQYYRRHLNLVERWKSLFRLLLSSLAYALLETIRRTALALLETIRRTALALLETIRRTALRGTALARAQCGTRWPRPLRIGAVILCNTRRIRLLLSSSHPHPELFLLAAARLKPD